jgi:signal transduction histidine kinase
MAFLDSMGGRTFLVLFLGCAGATILGTLLAAQRMHHPIVVAAYGFGILVLAYPIAQMATRPLRDLARAATRLGDDMDSPPLCEAGPAEVRAASRAFNTMQARIRRDVAERTFMLAAITHDLQTPVTRLRLRLEKVADEELRRKLVADLAVMNETIREGLDLARSLESRDTMQRVAFDSVLQAACADAEDAGHDVVLEETTGATVVGNPRELRRCVVNLIDNAVAYGRYARIAGFVENDRIRVTVRDGGDGIPEPLLERVFEPFMRVETSRSRETGGTGIGLTIARNVAERHGGFVRLRNHPLGGCEAVLDLPCHKTSV